MSFIDSITATTIATLTRRGKELLASDSSKLNIVKFAFDDAEINYSDFDGSTPDAPNSKILSTPILQPTTNSQVGLRWGIATLPKNTTVIAKLISDRNSLVTTIEQNESVIIKTLYGYDAGYYVSTNSSNIVLEKDFYEGTSDVNNFDVFQRQSMCTISFTTINTTDYDVNKIITITIKGKDTGSSITIIIRIKNAQATKITVVDQTEPIIINRPRFGDSDVINPSGRPVAPAEQTQRVTPITPGA